jgi:hypothetical protein
VEQLHHKSIKTFKLDGIIKSDSAISRLRLEVTKLKIEEMREEGYVQRLDIDPNFTIQYNHIEDYYEFTLTVYGTYVGKKKAQCTQGIDGTSLVPIQKNKLKESSLGQVSKSNQK